jgi:holo-[acyl-carrier protein] synthase
MAEKIKSIGCDIVKISRIQKLLDKYDQNVLSYLFTEKEFLLCSKRVSSAKWFAICFAGKEAVSKTLGTGFVGISWNNIEVFPRYNGSARIKLSSAAFTAAKGNFFVKWHCQWTLYSGHIYVNQKSKKSSPNPN